MIEIYPDDLAVVLRQVCLYAARKAADTLPDYDYERARTALEHDLDFITKQSEAIVNLELRLLHGYGDRQNVTRPQIDALNAVLSAACQECAALLAPASQG